MRKSKLHKIALWRLRVQHEVAPVALVIFSSTPSYMAVRKRHKEILLSGKTSKAGVVAALSLLAGAPVAWSQSSVNLYGAVDVAVGQLERQLPGPTTAPVVRDRGVFSGGWSPSFFGLRGTEDLGSGWKAKFQLESFMRVDTGESGRFSTPVQDPFWSRFSWVGLESGLGELRLGNNSNPMFAAQLVTSAFGGSPLFSPFFRQQYNGSTRASMPLEPALPNSVWYATPRIAGAFTVTLAAQANEGRGAGHNFSGNLLYRSGPLVLAYGGARVRNQPVPQVAVPRDQTMHVFGGTYDFGVATAFLQYTLVDDKQAAGGLLSRKITTPHIGLSVPIGVGEFKVASGRAEQEAVVSSAVKNTSVRTTTSFAYLHNLSKRTHLYAVLSTDKVPVGPINVAASPPQMTARSYVAGVRHTF